MQQADGQRVPPRRTGRELTHSLREPEEAFEGRHDQGDDERKRREQVVAEAGVDFERPDEEGRDSEYRRDAKAPSPAEVDDDAGQRKRDEVQGQAQQGKWIRVKVEGISPENFDC